MIACGDEEPFEIEVAPSVEAHARPLLDLPIDAAFVTAAGVMVVETPEGAAWVEDGALRALPGVVGPVVGVADTTAGVLIATASRADVLSGGTLAAVQLGDPENLGDLVAVTGAAGAVWVVGQRGLGRIAGDRITAIRPATPWSAPPRAVAPAPDGRVLYLVVDGGLLRAELAGSALTLTRVDGDDMVAVGVGAHGTPVSLSGAGLAVDLDGRRYGGPAARSADPVVVGHPRAAVWARADAGLVRWNGEVWTPVDGLEPSDRLLAATPEGGAVVSGPGGTRVVHAGPAVGVFDLPAVLTEPVRLQPWSTRPETVAVIELEAEGRSIAADADGRFPLDPADFGNATVELVLRAKTGSAEIYAEGTRSLRSAPAEPPTWSAEIALLFEDKCSLCHGEGATARPLFARDAWIEDIESILDNVSTGRMPLPPVELLDPSEIARVRTWSEAGFPE
jgi:mono/diheme cytochrome c family protein